MALHDRDAGKRFLALSKEAQTKEKGNDLDGAIQAWQRIADRWGIKRSVDEANTQIARIKSKKMDLAAKAYQAKISAEMAILRAVDEKTLPDRETLAFPEVSKRYQQLKDARRITTKEVRGELDGRIRDYTHAQLAMMSLVSSCQGKAKKGNVKLPQARWKGREARIEGADAAKISVSYVQRMRLQTKVKWVDFTRAELLAVCVEHLPAGGQSNIHRGVLALIWGLGSDATREFETARRDPAFKREAESYLARLKTGGVVDAKAEADAAKLRSQALALLFQAENTQDSKKAIDLYRQAEAKLEQLKSKFPGTKAAKGK